MEYSIEQLHHIFRLQCCPDKYFTIGDFQNFWQDELYCPFCGTKCRIKKVEDKK